MTSKMKRTVTQIILGTFMTLLLLIVLIFTKVNRNSAEIQKNKKGKPPGSHKKVHSP